MMLSIIIPAYNCADSLPRAVESVLHQPFEDWELIIVDDGSKDDTPALIDALAKSDARIHPVHIPNGGAYMARLKGIKQARGEYIMFIDADDSITPEGITGLIKHCSCDADIIVGTLNLNNRFIYKQGISGSVSPAEYCEAVMGLRTSIGTYGKLYHYSVLDRVPVPEVKITQNEDMLLLLSAAARARSIYVDPSLVCYNYMLAPGGQRENTMSEQQWLTLFTLVERLVAPLDEPRLADAHFAMMLDRLKRLHIERGLTLDPASELSRYLLEHLHGRSLSTQQMHTLALLTNPLKASRHYRRHYRWQHFKAVIKARLKRLAPGAFCR